MRVDLSRRRILTSPSGYQHVVLRNEAIRASIPYVVRSDDAVPGRELKIGVRPGPRNWVVESVGAALTVREMCEFAGNA